MHVLPLPCDERDCMGIISILEGDDGVGPLSEGPVHDQSVHTAPHYRLAFGVHIPSTPNSTSEYTDSKNSTVRNIVQTTNSVSAKSRVGRTPNFTDSASGGSPHKSPSYEDWIHQPRYSLHIIFWAEWAPCFLRRETTPLSRTISEQQVPVK